MINDYPGFGIRSREEISRAIRNAKNSIKKRNGKRDEFYYINQGKIKSLEWILGKDHRKIR